MSRQVVIDDYYHFRVVRKHFLKLAIIRNRFQMKVVIVAGETVGLAEIFDDLYL